MLILVTAALLLLPQEGPGNCVTINVDHVWGLRYHHDHGNAVVITVDNPGEAVEGTLVLRWGLNQAFQKNKVVTPSNLEGVRGSLYEIPITLPEKSRRRHFAYVRGEEGGQSHALWAFVLSGKECLARFCAVGDAFKDDQIIVGQVGLGGVVGPLHRRIQSAVCRSEDLPDRCEGYAHLHALLWLDADAATVREPAQIEALKAWVVSGGHLVIARSDTAGVAGTFLEGFLPVRPLGAREVSGWSALASWCGARALPSGTAAVLETKPRRGARVLVESGELPLVTEMSYGRGRVTFIAFNPAARVFNTWRPKEVFWEKLLEVPPPPKEEQEQYSWNQPDGLDRSLGSRKLASMMGEHPGMRLPSMGWAFIMIFVYLLLVGPVDYFVLKKLGKMELTWVTFPLCTLVFSAIALAAGSALSKLPPRARDVAVVDHHPGAELTCGWSVTSIVTPSEERLSVASAKPRASLEIHSVYGFSGSDDLRYKPSRVENWFLPHGATGAAVVRWSEKGARLRVAWLGAGKIRVTNETGFAIEDACYVSGMIYYPLGKVAEGVTTRTLAEGRELKEEFRRLGIFEDPSDSGRHSGYNRHYSSEYVTEEETMRLRLRTLMMNLSLRRALDWKGERVGRGLEFDATRWIEKEGDVFLGWGGSPGVLAVEGFSPLRTRDVMMRVFVRHDQD